MVSSLYCWKTLKTATDGVSAFVELVDPSNPAMLGSKIKGTVWGNWRRFSGILLLVTVCRFWLGSSFTPTVCDLGPIGTYTTWGDDPPQSRCQRCDKLVECHFPS